MLLTIINRKLLVKGKVINKIDTYSVKASQYYGAADSHVTKVYIDDVEKFIDEMPLFTEPDAKMIHSVMLVIEN